MPKGYKLIGLTDEELKERKREQGRRAQQVARLKDPEKHKAIDNARNQNPSIARRYGAMKGVAKTRNKSFSITKEEYVAIIAQPCYYCAFQLGTPAAKLGGLDRLDNSRGYELDNVVSCCMICNFMRGAHLTPEETKIAVAAILDYRSNNVCYEPLVYNPNINDIIIWKQNFNERMLFAIGRIKDPNKLSPERRYVNAIYESNRKERQFTLTKEEYTELAQHECYYCNFELGTPVQKGIGLDRIDSSLGYQSGNVLPCCYICNIIKGPQLTVYETKVAVQAILKYRKLNY